MYHRLPVLIALTLALLSASPAGAAVPFGFNDNAGLYGQVSPGTAATAAQAAGATSTRISVDWRTVEATRGVRDFGSYDALYNAALDRGQRPLFVISFAPAWARPAGACAGVSDCTVAPAPEHVADYAALAAAIAKRYPRAAGIEVWNEPNLRHFWGGNDPDPARYTELLRATYAAVKAVAPTPVITGGLAVYSGEDGATPGMGVRQFVDGMYAAGAKGNYDGLGLHPYPSFQLWYGYRGITLVKEAQAANGDTKPLWFTEIGISTTGSKAVSESDQARLIARVVPRFMARTDVGGVYVHTLYEPTWAAASSEERSYGVLTTTGQRKPAYCALAALYVKKLCGVPPADTAQNARWDAEERLQAAAEAAIRHKAAAGTYASLTSKVLANLDPTLSGIAVAGDLTAGGSADPSRIGIWSGADGQSVLLCNASRADRTYCIWNHGPGGWIYGSSTETAYGTAGALTTGSVWWW